MRLRDKKSILVDVAAEKKQQVDEGVVIAKKVDLLRQTLIEEEKRLNDFRSQTLPRVHAETEAETRTRDDLVKGNDTLRAEREKLLAPVDLTNAWKKVRDEQASNEETRASLSTAILDVDELKSSLENVTRDLQRRERALTRAEEAINTNLMDAENKNKEAAETLETARHEAELLLKRAEVKDRVSTQRENALDNRENYLAERELKAQDKEVDLAKREKVLRDRYATLERTLQRIKK